MGYSRKNQNSNGGWEHGIFRGIEERTCGNSRGQLKKEWNFQGCMKKIMEYPGGKPVSSGIS